jgi:hypothetical protein
MPSRIAWNNDGTMEQTLLKEPVEQAENVPSNDSGEYWLSIAPALAKAYFFVYIFI